ncbi:MAG: hypothetical protein ACREQQ_14115, partial [Candidatus Binatia bacterium]
CCTWVDVNDNENPSATTIAVDDSYKPNVCTLFNLGSHHYWTAESLFLVSNPGGGFDGHPPAYEAFKRLDFYCPLVALP